MKVKKLLFAITLAVVGAGFTSCSDTVDESNMYIFEGKTAADYIKEDPDLSYYLQMLKQTRSGKKGSTMDHLLETRGNYTVFVPTNDAVQHYLVRGVRFSHHDIFADCPRL